MHIYIHIHVWRLSLGVNRAVFFGHRFSGSFPKSRSTFLGVAILRILVLWGLVYVGVIVLVKKIERGIWGSYYPKPYSIYLRGTINPKKN